MEMRVSWGVSIFENQFEFISRRSVVEAIFLVRKRVEQSRERGIDLRAVFIDLKRACNKVSMEVVCR